MRPLDPRLLHRASAARTWVVLSATLQALSAALLVAQAWWLAHAVAAVVGGAPAATALVPGIGLIVVLLARAGLAALAARFADRAATTVIRQLRSAVLDHVERAGLGQRSAADVTILATTGLDQLDGYLVRYLPQLLATALITPGLLVIVFTQDWISGLIMAGTIPLVPFFMALVGWTTQKLSDDRIAVMRRLGDQVLDLVAGLATLRALGRALPQAKRVRAVGEAYRKSTTKVLQVAFLSGFVLELLTTISVALVAVGIGMRLVYGQMDLSTGLTILILAPEVYLPLRMVGQHFHASTDGIAAANAVLDLLDDHADGPASGRTPAPAPVRSVRWTDVSVAQPGRDRLAPSHFTGTALAGEITALVGENGAGKSTVLAAALGVRSIDGSIDLAGSDGHVVGLPDVDLDTWHAQIAWVPQHPTVIAGTLADNVRLLAPDASDDDLTAAAIATGFDDVVADLTNGWQTAIGEGGVGLSAGQRQRLALARAHVRMSQGATVLLLDEPSAHLDRATEEAVLDLLRTAARDGLVVVVVAHRQRLVAAADTVLTVNWTATQALASAL